MVREQHLSAICVCVCVSNRSVSSVLIAYVTRRLDSPMRTSRDLSGASSRFVICDLGFLVRWRTSTCCDCLCLGSGDIVVALAHPIDWRGSLVVRRAVSKGVAAGMRTPPAQPRNDIQLNKLRLLMCSILIQFYCWTSRPPPAMPRRHCSWRRPWSPAERL